LRPSYPPSQNSSQNWFPHYIRINQTYCKTAEQVLILIGIRHTKKEEVAIRPPPLFLPHTQNFHRSIWGLSQDELLELVPRECEYTILDSDLYRHSLSPFRLKFARQGFLQPPSKTDRSSKKPYRTTGRDRPMWSDQGRRGPNNPPSSSAPHILQC